MIESSNGNKSADTANILTDPGFILTKIRNFIKDCEQIAQQGKTPKLEGLDSQVAELCAAITALEPAQYQRLKPKLDSLVEELNSLGEKLNRQKQDIERQITGLTQQQKANAAYQKTGAAIPQTENKNHRSDAIISDTDDNINGN